MSAGVVESEGCHLSGKAFSNQAPKDGEHFVAPDFVATLAGPDFSPGQSTPIGQRGYRLVIFQYRFDGVPAGHTGSHSGDYTNGLPAEWRAGDGEYRTVTLGPVCGRVNERITVYTYDNKVGVAEGSARVLVAEFQAIGSSSDYVLIGETTHHPGGSNHYGTPGTNSSLSSIAQEYRSKTGDRLYINDQSLTWGGLFDISGQWSPPHAEHRDGKKADISATSETLKHEETFVEILKKYTSDYLIEGSGASRHYHARFP